MLKFVPVTSGKLYSQSYTCGDIKCDNVVGVFLLNRLRFLTIDESLKCFNINVLVGICDTLACGGKIFCLIRISLYQVLFHLKYDRTLIFKLDFMVVSAE